MLTGDVIFDRNLGEVLDLERAASRGDEGAYGPLCARLKGFVARQSAWQWVVQGDTQEFRKGVVEWLVETGSFVRARRFALCGRGDVLVTNGAGKRRVKPMGCGLRCCPRCSRRAGRRALARVASHLSTKGHGSLWHVVLTQRAEPEESVSGARQRFERAWKRFYPGLRRAGMMAGLATYHVRPSSRFGWHYHCHLLVELDDAVDCETLYDGLSEEWQRAKGEQQIGAAVFFMRRIADAGPAMPGLAKDTQMDFFEESGDAVEVCMQYMVRDILQGVEGWVKDVRSPSDVAEFAATVCNAKLHRMYGAWRKGVPGDGTEGAVAEEERCDADEAPKGVKSEWWTVMGMGELIGRIREGQRSLLVELEQLLAGRTRSTGVSLRLSRLVSALQR